MTVIVSEPVVTVIEVSDNDVVVISEDVETIVEIGIQGPQGIQGIPGINGTSSTSYTHAQQIPASVWSIPHNLGYYPNVTVVDTLLRTVIGDVFYQDVNTIIITFSAPFSGSAFLS